jgi:Mor family transcriptional regulator
MAKEFDLTKLPDDLLPAAEELPGELRIVAQHIGVRATLVLEQHWGGVPIYVSKCDALRRQLRDAQIRADYDRMGLAGDANVVARLARKYDLCLRQIKAILGRAGDVPDDRQLELFS